MVQRPIVRVFQVGIPCARVQDAVIMVIRVNEKIRDISHVNGVSHPDGSIAAVPPIYHPSVRARLWNPILGQLLEKTQRSWPTYE